MQTFFSELQIIFDKLWGGKKLNIKGQSFDNFPQRNNDFSRKYTLLYEWISCLKVVKKNILILSKLLHLYLST